jgi:hypothetical protein
MVKRATLLAVACLMVVLATPITVTAQDTSGWSTDSSLNTLLLKGGYWGMAIADDGSGGVVLAWAQSSYWGADIYAQRLNAAGVPQWNPEGVILCTGHGRNYSPLIVGDGSGGAMVTWWDDRSLGLQAYAQKVDASGTPQWTANGVAICASEGSHEVRAIISDFEGGAIVAWTGLGNPSGDLFVQKINSAGEPQWGESGVALSSDTRMSYSRLAMINDGSGGLIIAWEDRGVVYADRVTSDGTQAWKAGGMTLYSTPIYQPRMALVSDSSEGAIVCWTGKHDNRSGIYGQRFDNVGQPLWGTEGVLVRSGAMGPVMTSDGAGGAFVAWTDEQNGEGRESGDIYAQRLNPDGTLAWEGDSLAICTAQNSPAMVSDGSDGVIIAWQDGRDSEATDVADRLWTDEVNVRHNDNIYAQRVDSSGEVLWASNGVPICTAPHLQTRPLMAACGSGSAILIWADYRDYPLEDMHTDFDVWFDWYGQRVDGSGVIGPGSGDHARNAGLPVWAWVVVAAGVVAFAGAAAVVWRRIASHKRMSIEGAQN